MNNNERNRTRLGAVFAQKCETPTVVGILPYNDMILSKQLPLSPNKLMFRV
ncbi:MAG: hypothetical protein IJ002_08800 [Clostridia bacterium]|nr:hypothetical protein [Clostridia bacterium]